MFRKAVSTLEGVKAGAHHKPSYYSTTLELMLSLDAVFSYQLPFNLIAVIIMWPMRYVLNARW